MRPTTDIIDPTAGVVVEKVLRKQRRTSELVNGAIMSIHIHGGESVGGTHWCILGETGKIRISGSILILHINQPVPWKVTIQDENVVTEETIEEDKPGQPAVHRLWDVFLKGDRES
jgi:hypothetical protein